MAIITDSYIRNTKGSEKPREMRVDECLYLRVTLKAGKMLKKWLLRYTDNNGKGQRYIFGEYPDISLLEARTRAAELLKQAKCGETLASVARRGKICRTFADTAPEWFSKMSEGWVAGHIERQRQRPGHDQPLHLLKGRGRRDSGGCRHDRRP